MPEPTTTKQRIPLERAESLAGELFELLWGACERLEVAGSIRRRKPEVGDIELVAVPKTAWSEPQIDLFGRIVSGPHRSNALDALCRRLRDDGTFSDRPDVNGRPAFGERYKRLTYKGVGLDLFSALPPAQFGVIMTIRTGCAEFSHSLVTSRLQGGWLPTGMRVDDGALWDRGAVVPTPEETDLFAAMGLPWLEPEQRTPDVLPAMKPRADVWRWYRRTGEPLGVERVPA